MHKLNFLAASASLPRMSSAPLPSPISWPFWLGVFGGAGAVAALWLHGCRGWPTILPRDDTRESEPPRWAERVSVHLVVFSTWALAFAATIGRGAPDPMIDTRLPFEKNWPVFEAAEWVYLSVYVVPMLGPWLAPTRGALREFSLVLLTVLAISLACFWLLPFGAPPRPFEPSTLAGRLLAWETSRSDFAAASLPSFHVFWGLLAGRVIAARGGVARWLGWGWAAAVPVACVAAGTHALADVVASFAIFAAVVGWRERQAAARRELRPIRKPTNSPAASAPAPK